MSFPLLANTVARAFPQGLDPDELERQRRVKRAATDPGVIAPEARLYSETPPRAMFRDAPVNPQPSISRASPVVDVTAGSDGVFRRAGESPALNTLSAPNATAPMRATYEPPATQAAPVDRQHVDFSQPNSMDALAVQRATPAQPFASDVDEGPATRRAREMGEVGAEPHQHGSSIGERLTHGLKLGGSAFLRSGFNPLIAAGEFAEGAIDPNAWHRYEFNRDYPRAVTAAHNEQGMQEANLQRELQRVGVTGDLPGGKPSLAKAEFNQRQEAQNLQRDWQRYYQNQSLGIKRDATNSLIKTRESRANVSEANSWLRNVAPYGTLTPEMRQQFEGRFGYDLPEDFDPQKHQLIDTGQGWQRIGIGTGSVSGNLVDPNTSNAVPSPKGAAIKAANERAAQAQTHADSRAANAQAGADRRATGRSSGRMTRAQAETQTAKDLGADEHGMVDNTAWKDAYDHAYAVFDYEKDDSKRQAAAARQADRTVKAGKRIPANKHPEFHLKVQGLMAGQAGGQGAPRQLSAADIKAYADVNYGGDVAKARARIASEHPDWRLP